MAGLPFVPFAKRLQRVPLKPPVQIEFICPGDLRRAVVPQVNCQHFFRLQKSDQPVGMRGHEQLRPLSCFT